MKMQHSHARVRPTIEALETRRLFSGNINVVYDTEHNTMYINGDNKTNSFSVLVTDGIVITPAPGTKLNGQTGAVIYAGVPDLVINTDNGDDVVEIVNPDPRQTISVNTGNGNDSVSLVKQGIAWTGVARLNISTGTGNDSVLVSLDSPFENELGDATIDTGAGNDHITFAEDIHVNGTLHIAGGAGKDVFNDDGLIAAGPSPLITGIESVI